MTLPRLTGGMAGARETALTAPDLTVVVPTFNERDNVRPLIDALDEALAHIHWEVVFVDDDSTDGTAAAVRAISRQDSRVRCVQRCGPRGLFERRHRRRSLAELTAPYVSHRRSTARRDAAILAEDVRGTQAQPLDIVVGRVTFRAEASALE